MADSGIVIIPATLNEKQLTRFFNPLWLMGLLPFQQQQRKRKRPQRRGSYKLQRAALGGLRVQGVRNQGTNQGASACQSEFASHCLHPSPDYPVAGESGAESHI